jgi:hypothetical protein
MTTKKAIGVNFKVGDRVIKRKINNRAVTTQMSALSEKKNTE